MHTASPQVQPETRPSLRNGFNGLWRALPGDEFFLATVAHEFAADQTRLGSTSLRELDTSNGCQDHTLLPYADHPGQIISGYVHSAEVLPRQRSVSFVPALASIAHDIALQLLARPTQPRPPHLTPRS